MKIREIACCKMTLPKSVRDRQSGIWNLEKNKRLRGAIDECMASGKEVFCATPGEPLYHILPEYPLIESAMQKPENVSLLKVRIVAYLNSEHLGVEGVSDAQ